MQTENSSVTLSDRTCCCEESVAYNHFLLSKGCWSWPVDGPIRDGRTWQCHLPHPQPPPIPRGSVQALTFLLICTKNGGINVQLSTFIPLFLWQRLSAGSSSFSSESGCFHMPCPGKSTCEHFHKCATATSPHRKTRQGVLQGNSGETGAV